MSSRKPLPITHPRKEIKKRTMFVYHPRKEIRRALPNKSKLLIYNCNDISYLTFKLGRHNLYLQSIRNINTYEGDSIPRIYTIRYNSEEDLLSFIHSFPYKVIRLFKTCEFKKGRGSKNREELPPLKFLYIVARNCLGLLRNKCIRIKARDQVIKDAFYNIFTEVNSEWNHNCTFDYDVYDVTFEARLFYDIVSERFVLVTFIYSQEYPNINAV